MPKDPSWNRRHFGLGGAVALVLAAVVFVQRWQALDTLDVNGLSAHMGLYYVSLALSFCAYLLAIVLAAVLRRWGWLVACVLLPVADLVFAIALLFEAREARTGRARQQSFEAAMSRAVAEEAAEGREDQGSQG